MNKATADAIRAICAAAGVTVKSVTLTAAKAQIESMIASSANDADPNQLRELLTPALAHRTKAGFSEALIAICSDVEQRLNEDEFNERVNQVIEKAKADYQVTFNEFEVAAAIRAIPFFSYSAVIKQLREGNPTAITFAKHANTECLRAGASQAEAEDYGREHGSNALNAFLNDVPLKRMRFHYLLINENPECSEADRDFACNCLLKVARRSTDNGAILDLFNDVDALHMGEVIPAGLKRRLLNWALAF